MILSRRTSISICGVVILFALFSIPYAYSNQSFKINTPSNANELDNQMNKLRQWSRPYLQSQPEKINLRTRREINGTWKSKVEKYWTKEDKARPALPGWYKPAFNDSVWDNVTVPEWRFERAQEGRFSFGDSPYRYPKSLVLWYRTSFGYEQVPSGKRVYLNFAGVDWEGHVWLNGHYLGSHNGYYEPFRFDVTDVLKQENTLAVRIFDGPGYGEPMSYWSIFPDVPSDNNTYVRNREQSITNHRVGGHHMGSGFGIHREVYLEEVSNQNIHEVFARYKMDKRRMEVQVKLDSAEEADVELELHIIPENFKGKTYKTTQKIKLDKAENQIELMVHMSEAHLWSPDSPYLYRVRAILKKNKKAVDVLDVLTGCRSFTIVSEENPVKGMRAGMPLLNGKPQYIRGTNVAGLNALWYWGMEEKLIDVILMLKAGNFNAVRSCQHVQYPEVRELLDRLGIMSEQDQGGGRAWRGKENFEQLVKTGRTLARVTYNNPGVVFLSFANETHFDPTKIIENVLEVDPERIIIPISGNRHEGKHPPGYPTMPKKYWSNVIDNYHGYPGWYRNEGMIWALNKLPKSERKLIVGEYGAEAIDSYESLKNYPEHLKVPAIDADTLWGYVQIQKADLRNLAGFNFKKPGNLGEYIEASQNYQAILVAEQTAFRRIYSEYYSGYFQFHFISAVAGHWPKSIVSHDLRPKKAYFEMAQANQPLVGLFNIIRKGSMMDVWVANDLPEKFEMLSMEWTVRDSNQTYITGQTKVDVPASGSVQVEMVDLGPVPENTDEITITIVLKDSRGKEISKYERDIFIKAWRLGDEIFGSNR